MKEDWTKVQPGTQLGRYAVVAAIGAGGMGAVFKARDTLLGRDVAIKVLPEHLRRDVKAQSRFEREARLLATLSHPNILAIHDFGEEQGLAFAVMELLEGSTLREHLRGAPLSVDAALHYALEMARGLSSAHAKGIVHRDLKPENVFLPTCGPLKILDFGLARLDVPEASTDTTAETMLTQPGTVLGTVAYMSPEQLRGLETDARTDVFAFGAVLHEMLSGRPPFIGRSSADIISAVLTLEAPPLPPAVAFAEAIVRACLDKEPARRYRSAEELVLAIEAIQLDSRSTVATSIGERQPPRPSEPARSIAVLPFADMSPTRSLDYLCDGIAEEILLALTKVDGLRVVARSSAFRFKGASEDVRHVGRTLGVDAVLEGSVRAAGDRIRVVTQLVGVRDGYQLWSDRFDRRLDDVFAVQDEIAASVASTLRVHVQGASAIGPALRGPHDPGAYTLYLKARHHWNRRTEADLHRSVDYFKACIARDPDYALAHAGLAEAYATLGIYGAVASEQAMPMARSAAEQALAINPSLPGALASLACVNALYDWSWIEADAQFRRAIDAMPGDSSARAWYAMNCLVPLRRFGEAEAELRHALEVDPLSPTIKSSLGIRSYFARRFDDAVKELSNVLDDDAHFALAHYFLALVLAELHREDEALREIDTAMTLSGGSPEMTSAAGYILARAGHVDRARGRLGELMARSTSRYVSPGLVAQVHAGLGDADEALTWLDKAVAVRAAEVAWLGVRPTFDSLRRSPRFHTVEARLGVGITD